MLVGSNESTATKNAGESLAIWIAMAMQQYDGGCITQWSASRASLEATGCRHLLSACAVSVGGRHGRRIQMKHTKH
jgi:hypothetical protein